MIKAINENQGWIGLVALIFSIVVYIFSSKKIGLVTFVVILILMALFYILEKRNSFNFNEVQKIAKILFIDDKGCEIVTNLKRNNFSVRKIDDVYSPTSDPDVSWANLIFVDYKDVGKKLFGKKEGLGLIKELRRIYGNKKRYVIYSTIQDFDGLVDFSFIRKNASYDEYISLITTEMSKL